MNKVTHANNDKAREAVIDAIHQASDAGRWMVAVWQIKDDRIELSHCCTWKFPTGDFEAAQGMLRAFCVEEKSRNAEPEVPGPLPQATLPFKFPFKEKIREISKDLREIREKQNCDHVQDRRIDTKPTVEGNVTEDKRDNDNE